MKIAILSALILGLVGCDRARPAPASATPAAAVTAPAVAPAMSRVGDDALAIGGGGACGSKFCKAGFYCCNASCSQCAPLGGGCTQQACATGEPGLFGR